MSTGQTFTLGGMSHRVVELTQHWRIIDGTPYRDAVAVRADGSVRLVSLRDEWDAAVAA